MIFAITEIEQISALPFVESDKTSRFYNILLNKRIVFSLFIVIALITGVKQYSGGSFSKNKIFKYTFVQSLSAKPFYYITFAGVSSWFMVQTSPGSKGMLFLFLFAFLLKFMSRTDLFPKNIRDTFIKPYSLKALPSVLVCLVIIYQMLSLDFKNMNTHA